MELAENVVVADRFRLNRQLGRGGMGSVWHATHLGLDLPCAVKFIDSEYARLPDAQARFEFEAKAAAHLRSPHVVQILDHGVWQGVPYIAMELLDGEALSTRMSRQRRMAPREVISILTQVCRALSKAHAMGIVHRDLKPHNIFLVRDDDREIAKVLDFGIAKAAATSIEGSNTKTGAMLGTPHYMSPEQAQGTKSVDFRSDLWSLGVVAFKAITGKLPFQSDGLGDLLMKILVGPIPVPSQVAADVPAGFDAWWLKACARDPEQRFQSAKEFAESLALSLGVSQVTLDAMDSPLAPVGMRASSRPASATVVDEGLAGSWSRPDQASARPPPSSPPSLEGGRSIAGLSADLPRRRSSAAVIAVVLGALVAVAGGAALAFAFGGRIRGATASHPTASGGATAALGRAAPAGQTSEPRAEPPVSVEAPAAASAPQPGASRVAVKPVSPPKPASRPVQGGARPNCDPNYDLDSDGVKHFKPECFR